MTWRDPTTFFQSAHPELVQGNPFATIIRGPATLSPSKGYGLILADPPWAFRTFNGANRTPTQKKFREAEDHYPTMPIEALKALPVGDLAGRDCALAMWIVGSHCDVALDLGRAWGFTFATDLFYWVKQKLVHADQVDMFTGDIPPPKMSMGYYSRKQAEACWLFTRGSPRVHAHDVRQLIIAPPTQHSRKPPEQYDRLERLFGSDTPRLELFSRTSRQGWDAWGNEVGKYDEEAA